jgi:thiol-disulfide isomerase/thioredoxin
MSSIAFVTLTVLTCANLVLLLGVVRRLNRLTVPAARRTGLPKPGAAVGKFTATTTEGHRVGTKDLSGPRLVGFFTVGCPPCDAFKPAFRTHAATFPGGRDQVLALIVGGKGDPTTLAAELADIARVVVEPAEGPVSTAFGVTGFPMACLLNGATITATGLDLNSFPTAGRQPGKTAAA